MPILGVIASSRSPYPAPAYWASTATSSYNPFYTYGDGLSATNGDYYIDGWGAISGVYNSGWWARLNNEGVLQASLRYTTSGSGPSTVFAGANSSCLQGQFDGVLTNGDSFIFAAGANTSNGTSANIMRINNSGAIQSQTGIKSISRSLSSDYAYAQAWRWDNTNSKIYLAMGVANSSGSGSSGLHATLIKMDSSFNIEWQRDFYNGSVSAGSRVDYCLGATIDASQNVYPAQYGTNTSGGYEAEIIKYNSSGTVQWQKHWAGSASGGNRLDLVFNSVMSADSAHIYAVGAYKNSSGGTDTFLCKFNTSDGSLVWTRDIQQNISASSRWAQPRGLVLDSNGNVYANGFYSTSGYKGWAVKYNSSGTVQWIREYTLSTDPMVAQGMDIDTNGTLTMINYAGSTVRPIFLRVPNDGSKTGSYDTGNGTITYSTTSNIIDTTTAVSQTNGTLTTGTGNAEKFTGFYSSTSFTPTINRVVIS
jgi:hypothetical protein